jgi:hypothetical protein
VTKACHAFETPVRHRPCRIARQCTPACGATLLLLLLLLLVQVQLAASTCCHCTHQLGTVALHLSPIRRLTPHSVSLSRPAPGANPLRCISWGACIQRNAAALILSYRELLIHSVRVLVCGYGNRTGWSG